jgi:hypothetical protein
MQGTSGTVRTQIPARMDRLPWCSWHWLRPNRSKRPTPSNHPAALIHP